ncbi:MAG: hypothetical protein KUG64_11180 [Cycloclasticus sp.]|nr:hypothetical protein [Cycloclasticus sp.]
MAEEIEVIIDDTQEEVSLFVGEPEGVTKHSELILDDGTNPHGTTLADVDDGFIAKTNEENTFTEVQTVAGVKSSENDPTKVFATDGSVVDVRQDDRLNDVGSVNASTLSLDFDTYEGWNATLTEDLTISITNGKFKVVTLDLTGDFSITYPVNSDVVGDAYDGTKKNTLTIHYRDASNILIIVTNWT